MGVRSIHSVKRWWKTSKSRRTHQQYLMSFIMSRIPSRSNDTFSNFIPRLQRKFQNLFDIISPINFITNKNLSVPFKPSEYLWIPLYCLKAHLHFWNRLTTSIADSRNDFSCSHSKVDNVSRRQKWTSLVLFHRWSQLANYLTHYPSVNLWILLSCLTHYPSEYFWIPLNYLTHYPSEYLLILLSCLTHYPSEYLWIPLNYLTHYPSEYLWIPLNYLTHYPSEYLWIKELKPRRRIYVEIPKPSRVELKCNAEGFDVISATPERV
jgi:hypothetical protein